MNPTILRPACGLAMAALLLVATTPSSFGQSKLEDQLVVQATGGAFEKALDVDFYQPFTKETGVPVVKVSATYDEMRAKVKAMAEVGTPEWDVVSTDPQNAS